MNLHANASVITGEYEFCCVFYHLNNLLDNLLVLVKPMLLMLTHAP